MPVPSPSRHRSALAAVLALLLALPLALAPTGAAAVDGAPEPCDPTAAAQPSALVPQPDITGPIGDEGIRTGEPYGTTMVPLPDGWVEEEFFIGGTARGFAASAGETAGYTSRILVRRPTDPADFNGTVILDWNNVTIPHDRDVAWGPIHTTVLARGYAYVSVAAQRLGVELSPLGLKLYDPVRYGALRHPGDDYSWDIFSQAAEATLTEQVLGDLAECVERRLAMGASQSATRLRTYINEVHEQSLVFDGFQPQIISVGDVRRDLVPILWVNSMGEVGATPVATDADLFRLWELAGAAHTSEYSDSYQDELLLYSHTGGRLGAWDAEAAGRWGYQSTPGTCLTNNHYQTSYLWSAALVALDDWVRTGEAPEPQPRVARDDDGTIQFDEHGNIRGGVRLPLVDVPIAAYFAGITPPPGLSPCGLVGGHLVLKGTTQVLPATALATLYASGEDYLEQFLAALDRAVAAGVVLPEGEAELRRRAVDAAAWVDDAVR
jgi:hypothetical protein